MKEKQIKIIKDEFDRIISLVEGRMNTQMDKFAQRLTQCRETSDTVDRIEFNYTEVVAYIEDNPPINTLQKISDIEGFVNESIDALHKTKDFKVYDLSINEKIKPLRAFLGHLLERNLPPKPAHPGDRLSFTLDKSLAQKINFALSK